MRRLKGQYERFASGSGIAQYDTMGTANKLKAHYA
jgi:hypothetical protein